MPQTIDLAEFGLAGRLELRGTVKSRRTSPGSPPLFLVGERHSVKPYIHANLLNVISLADLGVISCVGVEGVRTGEVREAEAVARRRELEAVHGADVAAVSAGLLAFFTWRDMYFERVLGLLRPEVPVVSVEDPALNARAGELEPWYEMRGDHIREVLRASPLFEPDREDRDTLADVKARMQYEFELAEEPVNHARDAAFIKNMLALWEERGRDKAAVLNLGSSHQYRVARLLPEQVGYIHVEQP